MQVLLTGIPGSGKTLYMISEVDRISKRDNRPVFYYGIKELTLPWHELTQEQVYHWFDQFPPNAIFCLDEGQDFFRPTSMNREPPEHITALEKHRHGGIDIWLTTQDPSFVHGHWRKLAGRHLHFLRKFGMRWSTIYEWTEVQENPKKGRHMATEKQWFYPKEYFGVYKSAEVHTHKVNIPKKIIFALLLPFLILGGLWYGFYSWYEQSFKGATGQKEKPAEQVQKTTPVRSSPPQNSAPVSTVQKPPVDAKASYLESRTPMLPGLPHTAPVYASIVTPKRAPAPVACVKSSKQCFCYTDDGTRLPQVPEHSCLQIVEHGFYVDWQIPQITPSRTAAAPRTERVAPAEQ